jgi:hypothetical protein
MLVIKWQGVNVASNRGPSSQANKQESNNQTYFPRDAYLHCTPLGKGVTLMLSLAHRAQEHTSSC